MKSSSNYIYVWRILYLAVGCFALFSCAKKESITFVVSMEKPESHVFHVTMKYENPESEQTLVRMPTWSPGYYQKLNYAENLSNLAATTPDGKALTVEQSDSNSWNVQNNQQTFQLEYDVLTDRQFVAESWLDEEHGYIIPGALFFYPEGKTELPVKISINPLKQWPDIATGLDHNEKNKFELSAADYDVLYDSPILLGKLDSLPSFEVQGIPHYFVGYKMEAFDKQALMDDLKKIVEVSAEIIGDIPYKQYTFIGIGPGQGGIEHLNSTTVSFTGKNLDIHDNRVGTLSFLAHEYFHHYNVKRIRPIELGPFDYQNGSKTKQLWISEGLSVYYEHLILKRAGISTEVDLLTALHGNMMAYENQPGRLFQSLAESSYETWSDGPFGRRDDEFNKTISYYNKGPIVGWLLDMKIRHETNNDKSLDDIMKALYWKYYKEAGRGFTEDEFKSLAEEITGSSIDDILEYVYTTNELDYNQYLQYAGYQIDTTAQPVNGAWLGMNVKTQNDTSVVQRVEWQSPAWESGIRRRNIITKINGQSPAKMDIQPMMTALKPGDVLSMEIIQNDTLKQMDIQLAEKKLKSFKISSMENLSDEQKQIRNSWLKGD